MFRRILLVAIAVSAALSICCSIFINIATPSTPRAAVVTPANVPPGADSSIKPTSDTTEPAPLSPSHALLHKIERETVLYADPYQPHGLYTAMARLERPVLIDALRFPDQDVQRFACAILRRQHVDGIEATELEAILSFVRSNASASSEGAGLLAAYGGLGHTLLVILMDESDSPAAATAAAALATEINDPDSAIRQHALKRMCDLLASTNKRAAYTALNYLINAWEPQVMPWLRENIRKPGEAQARRLIADVLASQINRTIGPHPLEDFQLLVDLLGDENPDVRYEALAALNRFPATPHIIRTVIGMTNDPAFGGRVRAMHYLTYLQAVEEPARAAIRRRLLDTSPYTAREAVGAVARLNDRDAMPYLVRLVAGPLDEKGRLSTAQIEAAQLVVTWTKTKFDFKQIWSCGLGLGQAYYAKERGKKLGGEEGRRMVEAAEAQMLAQQQQYERQAEAVNARFLKEREKLLAWWREEGAEQFPPIIELAEGVK